MLTAGRALLIGALAIALYGVAASLYGARTRNTVGLGGRSGRAWIASGRRSVYALFGVLATCFLILELAFLRSDFSFELVATHSSTTTSSFYRATSIWSSQEGSLLLWALILGGWTFAVSIFSRQLPQVMLARVLAVMGMISIGFLLFLIMTSNPFTRILPQIPADGHDLNPLLQDIGLIVHPPMLYMGYVGFSVAFAFAKA